MVIPDSLPRNLAIGSLARRAFAIAFVHNSILLKLLRLPGLKNSQLFSRKTGRKLEN